MRTEILFFQVLVSTYLLQTIKYIVLFGNMYSDILDLQSPLRIEDFYCNNFYHLLQNFCAKILVLISHLEWMRKLKKGVERFSNDFFTCLDFQMNFIFSTVCSQNAMIVTCKLEKQYFDYSFKGWMVRAYQARKDIWVSCH